MKKALVSFCNTRSGTQIHILTWAGSLIALLCFGRVCVVGIYVCQCVHVWVCLCMTWTRNFLVIMISGMRAFYNKMLFTFGCSLRWSVVVKVGWQAGSQAGKMNALMPFIIAFNMLWRRLQRRRHRHWRLPSVVRMIKKEKLKTISI